MTPCYFCASDSTSYEHVPPKGFFESGMPRITVRSCDEHNVSRSKDDEYTRLIIAGTAWKNVPERVKGKIRRSASRGRGPALKVLGNLYGEAATHRHYDVEIERLERCAEAMARAVIFAEFKVRHPTTQPPDIIFDFVENPLDASPESVVRYALLRRMARDLMREVPFKGGAPNIFKYKPSRYCVQLCFYNRSTITVVFESAGASSSMPTADSVA